MDLLRGHRDLGSVVATILLVIEIASMIVAVGAGLMWARARERRTKAVIGTKQRDRGTEDDRRQHDRVYRASGDHALAGGRL